MAKSSQSPGESLFFVPFNLFHYLGFVPFKTQLNEDTNRYVLHTNFAQKIICVIFHTIAVVNQTNYFVISCLQFRSNSETNIVNLFDSVSNFTFSTSRFLVIFHIWRRQQGYLQFLEYSRCKQERKKCRQFIVYVAFILWSALITALTWVLLNDSGHFINLVTSADNGTATPFQQSNVTESGNENNSDFQWNFDKLVYWGQSMLYLCTVSFFVFIQGLLYMITMALGQLGTEFRIKLKTTVNIDQGIFLLRKLRRATDFSRKLYGDYVLTYYISTVAYCVQAPHILMGKRGNTEKLILFTFALTNIVWIWAAQFHHSVHEAIVEWISFHAESTSLSLEDRLKLLSIRYDVSTDPVAISCRCFRVTYKHICSMLGIVATYGIIVVQLNRE